MAGRWRKKNESLAEAVRAGIVHAHVAPAGVPGLRRQDPPATSACIRAHDIRTPVHTTLALRTAPAWSAHCCLRTVLVLQEYGFYSPPGETPFFLKGLGSRDHEKPHLNHFISKLHELPHTSLYPLFSKK